MLILEKLVALTVFRRVKFGDEVQYNVRFLSRDGRKRRREEEGERVRCIEKNSKSVTVDVDVFFI